MKISLTTCQDQDSCPFEKLRTPLLILQMSFPPLQAHSLHYLKNQEKRRQSHNFCYHCLSRLFKQGFKMRLSHICKIFKQRGSITFQVMQFPYSICRFLAFCNIMNFFCIVISCHKPNNTTLKSPSSFLFIQFLFFFSRFQLNKSILCILREITLRSFINDKDETIFYCS